jgi:hypothetical protein
MMIVPPSPSTAFPPGRGVERVQMNLFHGDQGMFGIALGLACPRRRAWPTSLRT